MRAITPRGTVQERHLSMGGGIKSEIYEKNCESCGERFETTVPHAEVCRKPACIAWRRKKADSAKNSRVKDLRERTREMRKALALCRETILGLNWMGSRRDDPRPAALKAIREALGGESDG